MTVICEECGKVYYLDPEKVEQYRGRNIQVRCGECGHVTQLSNLIDMQEELSSESFETESDESAVDIEIEDIDQASEDPALDTLDTSSISSSEEKPAVSEPASSPRSSILGLRGKMMFLFLVIPILLIAATGYFSQMQLTRLGDNIAEQSTALVLEEGKNRIMQKARDVAFQCEIYLRAHPELDRKDFAFDPVFSEIAVQQVGKTGYTALIQEAEPEAGYDWTIWAHPNPNLIGGENTVDILKKSLGPFFDPFWDVITGSAERKESEGFYRWKDADGKIRQKYTAMTPVNLEGKPFVLMATAYADEFTRKTEDLQASAMEMSRNTRNINLAILIGAIILIGLCITIYGHRLTRRIGHLTEAAERISVGDLEAEIEIKSRDEIGNLADAISRMQDSLRLSIERLRRRR